MNRSCPALLLFLLPITMAIAGCTMPTDTATVEEQRLDAAARAMPDLAARLAVPAITDHPNPEHPPEQRLQQQAVALWRSERDRIRDGHLDDRPLYWRRLAATRTLNDAAARHFDTWSRGSGDDRFRPDTERRILVTGFDPFRLDDNTDQSNPSGVAALALDDRILEVDGRRCEIQSLLFPVRFADFDRGAVEQRIGAHLDRLDLLVTISMGRDVFDLERFPGKRRSAEADDNLRVLTGASASNPLLPMLDGRPLDGPEFVEFSLPAAAMMQIGGRWPVRDNRTVTTLQRGTFEAASLAELDGQTAVRGGGGGYLSNEISYRSIRLLQSRGLDIPAGHIHTPRIAGHDHAAIADMLAQIEAMLTAAIRTLP